jgi:transposase-like protein
MDLTLGAPRRRWARGEKLAAVAATFSPGVTVTTATESRIANELGFATRQSYSDSDGEVDVCGAFSDQNC